MLGREANGVLGTLWGLPAPLPPSPALHTPPQPSPRPTGAPHGFGLEVGSKAELVLVMAQLAGAAAARPGINLVCNGYKDAEYMELVGAGDGVGWRWRWGGRWE